MRGKENRFTLYRRGIILVLILVTAIFQNTEGFFPSPFGIRAFLLLPLIVCIGMFEREIVGGVFGLIAGAVWDMSSSVNDGYNALFLMLAGFLCGLLVHKLLINNYISALMLCSITIFLYIGIYFILIFVVNNIENSYIALLKFYIPSSIYTLITLPLYYSLMRYISKRLRTKAE